MPPAKTRLAALPRSPKARGSLRRPDAVTFLVLLAASTWTWFVPSDLRPLDHRLLFRATRSIPADELQVRQLFFLFPLDVTSEILERSLSRLMVACSIRRSVDVPGFRALFIPLFDLGERHLRRVPVLLVRLHEEQEPNGLVLDPVHHVL